MLDAIAADVERYIEQHLFDPTGLMYAYIDSHTGQTLPRDLVLPEKAPYVPARHGPWEYWTYEDTIFCMGMYLDTQMRKLEMTGERASCLDRARKLWLKIRDVYALSQVYGIGSFLRPYGGLSEMERFMEPLGTDQAGPLFVGLYFYRKQILTTEPAVAQEIADLMVSTLSWYERQGFKYLYYKSFIHDWTFAAGHATSFYLPAIAFAAAVTGEDRWQNHLRDRLAWFRESRIPLHVHPQGAMCWGGDLLMLKDILGDERFAEVVPESRIEETYQALMSALRMHYTEARGTMRQEEGRCWPKNEPCVMAGLAMLGHRKAADELRRMLAEHRDVPRDFCIWLSEDYDRLAPAWHLWARATGDALVEWYRNYWMLRQADRNWR